MSISSRLGIRRLRHFKLLDDYSVRSFINTNSSSYSPGFRSHYPGRGRRRRVCAAKVPHKRQACPADVPLSPRAKRRHFIVGLCAIHRRNCRIPTHKNSIPNPKKKTATATKSDMMRQPSSSQGFAYLCPIADKCAAVTMSVHTQVLKENAEYIYIVFCFPVNRMHALYTYIRNTRARARVAHGKCILRCEVCGTEPRTGRERC